MGRSNEKCISSRGNTEHTKSRINSHFSTKIMIQNTACLFGKLPKYCGKCVKLLRNEHSSTKESATDRCVTNTQSPFCHSSQQLPHTTRQLNQTHAPRRISPLLKLLFIYLFIIALRFATSIFTVQHHPLLVAAQSPENPSDSIIRYSGRRWYLAGKFSELYNDMDQLDEPRLMRESPIESMTVKANNVAYFDGRQFYAMNNGTNGEVYELQIDSCLNVFVGGNFTHVSNGDGEEPILTGPVARWDALRNRWTSLLDEYTYDEFNDEYRKENRAYWWDGHENKVYSIAVDCWRMPSNMMECECDVYIGGSFVLMFADGRNATNLARWNAYTLQWEDLGGPVESGINDVNKPVRALWRFDENINIVIKALWVGGEFDGYLKRRMLRYTDQSWWNFPDINGPANVLHYQFNPLGRDILIVGGDFNFSSTSNGGVQCQYLCTYYLHPEDDYAGWRPPNLAGNDTINAPVTSLSMIDSSTYYFVSNGEPYVYYSEDNDAFNSDTHSQPLISVDTCSHYELGCTKGSMAILGHNNYMRFFDAARRTWHVIGNETKMTDGFVAQLEMVYHGAAQGLWRRGMLWQSMVLVVVSVFLSSLF